MSFKAKGLLLPSLPDIVPVIINDVSLEFLSDTAVDPALTVTPLYGLLPLKTHAIDKLFVKVNLLPVCSTFILRVINCGGGVLPLLPLLASPRL